MSLRQTNIRIALQIKLVFILSIFLLLFTIVRSFPLGQAEQGSTPCFSHSDCLMTEMCAWNTVVVDLAGTCVTVSHQQLYDWTDQRYQFNEPRPGRKRRELSLFDDVDADGKVNSRQARNIDLGAIERRVSSGGERWGNDRGDVTKVDTVKGSEEEEEDNVDYMDDIQNDKQTMQSQASRGVPQASYPLPHKLLDKGTYHRGDDNGNDDEVVIDHFDEKGRPVVVITADNTDQHGEIDTSKDFYTFGEEAEDNEPDTDADTKTESTFYDYKDGSDVADGGYDGERVVIDLKGGRIHPGIKSVFSNPWGLQPIRAIQRPADNVVGDEDDEYFNDDVQVYGVGDHQDGVGDQPRFEHTDLMGTGIETDVGVLDQVRDHIRDQRPAPRLTGADQIGPALPGLLIKDLEAHNY